MSMQKIVSNPLIFFDRCVNKDGRILVGMRGCSRCGFGDSVKGYCYRCQTSYCSDCEEIPEEILKDGYEKFKEVQKKFGEDIVDYDTFSTDRQYFFVFSITGNIEFLCENCREFEKIKKEKAKLKALLFSQNLDKDMLCKLYNYLK